MLTYDLRVGLLAALPALVGAAAYSLHESSMESFPRVSAELSVEEEWRSFGEGPEGPLSSVAGLVVLPSGEIWVSDARTSRVIALSESGEWEGTIARPGDGPGEVRGPMFGAVAPGRDVVGIYDISRSAIELFNTEGEPIDRIQLDAQVLNPKGFEIDKRGQFYISGGIPSHEGAVHVFSEDGSLIRSLYSLPQTENPRAGVMVGGGALELVPEGNLFFSVAAPHRILEFTGSSEAPNVLASDSELLDPVGDDFIYESERDGQRVRMFRWRFPKSVALLYLSSGELMNIVKFQEDDRSIWEVYDSSGRVVSRSEVDLAYHPYAMTADGDVLAKYEIPATHEEVVVRLSVNR